MRFPRLPTKKLEALASPQPTKNDFLSGPPRPELSGARRSGGGLKLRQKVSLGYTQNGREALAPTKKPLPLGPTYGARRSGGASSEPSGMKKPGPRIHSTDMVVPKLPSLERIDSKLPMWSRRGKAAGEGLESRKETTGDGEKVIPRFPAFSTRRSNHPICQFALARSSRFERLE